MNKISIFTLLILSALQLSGCTSDELKRAGYEALYQNQCMREKRVPDCDPGHMDYDEYKRVKEAELQGGRADR